MQTLHLPLARCQSVAAYALIAAAAALVLVAGVQWPWRLVLVAMTIVVGVASWRRYQRTRPWQLQLGEPDRLVCHTLTGDGVAVHEIRLGVVTPLLASAVLVGQGGERFALFVPGCALASAEHHALRRALLAWRPPGGAEGGPDGTQSSDRRGT